MPETLFQFNSYNFRQCQGRYRGKHNDEYYLGDYSIEESSIIDVRARKKQVGVCSIILLSSSTRLFFRRSISHIREDGLDVTVLWFVKRGRLCVWHPCGLSIAKAGDLLVTNSIAPTYTECYVDEGSTHEVLHMIVPTHLLRRYIPNDVRVGFCATVSGGEFGIVERILTDVFEDLGELSEPIAHLLLNTSLAVLSDALAKREAGTAPRPTIGDKRLRDVLRFVEVHLADPKLDLSRIAEGCGISTRYLCQILKRNGMRFHTLIWQKRLEAARVLLRSPAAATFTVKEIAHKAGFKSPAHFTRMFKRVFNVNPSECRDWPSAPEYDAHASDSPRPGQLS